MTLNYNIKNQFNIKLSNKISFYTLYTFKIKFKFFIFQ